MTQESLMAEGFTKEQATQILETHKAAINGQYVPKARFDEVNEYIQLLRDTAGLNTEDISDGKNSFGTLYAQRTIFFSIICNIYKERAFKTEDQPLDMKVNEYFTAAIRLDDICYYLLFPAEDWDLFKIPELEFIPEGLNMHTKNNARRLSSLSFDNVFEALRFDSFIMEDVAKNAEFLNERINDHTRFVVSDFNADTKNHVFSFRYPYDLYDETDNVQVDVYNKELRALLTSKLELIDEPNTEWVPKYGDYYYYVDFNTKGYVTSRMLSDSELSKQDLMTGNYFKEREQAEACALEALAPFTNRGFSDGAADAHLQRTRGF